MPDTPPLAKPMRIAIVHSTATIQNRGSESYAWDLARYLVHAGHEVKLYAGTTPRPHIRYTEVPLITAPVVLKTRFPHFIGDRLRALAQNLTFAWNLRSVFEDTDIINIHKPFDLPFALWFRSRRKCRIVWRCHGRNPFPGDRWLVPKADAIFCVSERAKEMLHDRFPRISTTVVHTGVDIDFWRPLDIPVVPGSILYFGSLRKFKNIHRLFHALSEIRSIPWTADVVGDGPERDSLMDMCRREGMDGRVAFHGEVYKKQDIRTFLSRAEIVVFPSDDNETFSIATLEAMAMEKAIIASKSGGFPEAIGDGREGLLVDTDNPASFASALAGLLGDRTLRRILGVQARRRVVADFDGRNSFGRVENMFKALVSDVRPEDGK